MAAFTDALRGYAFPVHQRDGFRCVYCGLDGRPSFENWLSLSWDHLLPKTDARRDDHEFIATACFFCNVADNQYFAKAAERRLSFTNKTRAELVAQRRPFVMKTREAYRQFWKERVQPR
jgi:5-methylcytosine-specific restriction endonuclease McrA